MPHKHKDLSSRFPRILWRAANTQWVLVIPVPGRQRHWAATHSSCLVSYKPKEDHASNKQTRKPCLKQIKTKQATSWSTRGWARIPTLVPAGTHTHKTNKLTQNPQAFYFLYETCAIVSRFLYKAVSWLRPHWPTPTGVRRKLLKG